MFHRPEASDAFVAAGEQAFFRADEIGAAPLEQGQQVGTLTLTIDDRMLATRPLEVLESVERAGFFGRMADKIKMWFGKK